jgi:hypothetical protein
MRSGSATSNYILATLPAALCARSLAGCLVKEFLSMRSVLFADAGRGQERVAARVACPEGKNCHQRQEIFLVPARK